jgi:two-component system chemotaxis sensor kinase CheA
VDKKNNDFLKRLLATFKIEAQEHVNAISTCLIELEKAPAAEKRAELTEAVFREAHSLKGAARAVSMMDIEAICQSLESVFVALKRQEIALSAELFDLLHQANDSLKRLLRAADAEQLGSEKSQIDELVRRLMGTAEAKGNGSWRLEKAGDDTGITEKIMIMRQQQVKFRELEKKEAKLEAQPADSRFQTNALTKTVRVSTAKLTPILLQAEELLMAKLAAGQQIAELRKVKAALVTWEREWAKVQPETQKLRHLLEKENQRDSTDKAKSQFNKPLEFLSWNHAHMKSLGEKLTALIKSGERDFHSLGSMVDNLLGQTKKVLMLPFSTLLEGFPKLVRDLSRDQKKEAELVIRGADVEVDRRILEEMKDAFIHLVRNCVDHGIEKPEERERKRKPNKGIIVFGVSQKNSHAEIFVSDDGAGMDVNRIKAAALKLGILSPEEADKITESEVLSLVFQSGVTTSPIITDVSGRGLGLAIVRQKVEKLGGTVSLETQPDAGTTFRIVLPLTLATFRGVIVRVAEQMFVLPTANVEQVVRVNKDVIKTIENRETIEIGGEVVSLVRLADVLELPQSVVGNSIDSLPAVVLTSSEHRIAFLVDEVINEQEVLVKTLGKQLARVRNVAGAAVLGTGKVVLILNIFDLMKSAVRISAAGPKPVAVPAEAKEAKRRSVLVVEDSITARTLLKNILEASGYAVVTAIDGVDAFTQLRTAEFDIVVSDVDMPRMNGFDLTARIRSDKKLADLPIVLVTALDSREDRERGIEIGADAYIVKSSFDQSNLLEVVRRLI